MINTGEIFTDHKNDDGSILILRTVTMGISSGTARARDATHAVMLYMKNTDRPTSSLRRLRD